jgi:hypothetical protein
MKNKQGQQEIAGFVIIIIIVCVIGLIFLSLSIGRMKSPKESSIEISNLIEASMLHTTDCAISFVPQYQSIQELIVKTYDDGSQKCMNEKTVKEELQASLKKLFDSGLAIGENSVNKGYNSEIYYQDLKIDNPRNVLANFSGGNFANCSSIITGDDIIPSGDYGTLSLELEVCKG